MNKNVFLFSGQGSQYVGMGKELCEIHRPSMQVFECAGDILGFDLAAVCFNGEETELSKTSVAQPAIMATSLAALEYIRAEGIEYHAVAGHSLGEYAALVASGMLSMEDGFRVIKHRAEAMQECATGQSGAMMAVLGVSAEEVEQVCRQIEVYVVPVNYNSPVQTVIAGEAEAIDLAEEKFAELGKRTAKLKVSAAFHSKFMQPAADKFYSEIKDIPFNSPNVDFYCNLTGKKLEETTDIPSYLAKHLVSPVQFVTELNSLFADGFTNYIELGPGRVLTGLVRKTLKGITAVNIENQKSFEQALAKLQ